MAYRHDRRQFIKNTFGAGTCVGLLASGLGASESSETLMAEGDFRLTPGQ
jgi:hypothetical protein